MNSETTSGSAVIAGGLATTCERVRKRIHELVTPLSHEQLWTKPYPYGNSVGHLLLHLTGNLSYYIGARIAGTGYVRDRPKEFADDSKRAKNDVLQAFDHAVDLTVATIKAQTADDWGIAYEAVGTDPDRDRMTIIIRCTAHLDHHMGQMIYLCKELERAAPQLATSTSPS